MEDRISKVIYALIAIIITIVTIWMIVGTIIGAIALIEWLLT